MGGWADRRTVLKQGPEKSGVEQQAKKVADGRDRFGKSTPVFEHEGRKEREGKQKVNTLTAFAACGDGLEGTGDNAHPIRGAKDSKLKKILPCPRFSAPIHSWFSVQTFRALCGLRVQK
jgi:hypothetical protein